MVNESKSGQISVTRALAELKTLNKRISKLTNETTFASTRVVGRPWNDHVDRTRSSYQALTNLIENYSKIKYAIIRSNAVTTVCIGGVTYTVAEAIAKKEMIRHQKELLARLKKTRVDISNKINDHNSRTQGMLENLLDKNFSQTRKSDDTDVKSITEAYLKNNRIEAIDPLNIEACIEDLETYVTQFEKEVDFTLSESNALTKLDI